MNFNVSDVIRRAPPMMVWFLPVSFLMFLLSSVSAYAERPNPFRFEGVLSLEEMKSFIGSRFTLESSREDLRNVFVLEGDATQIIHPSQLNIEKYIYDINLCSVYVWRWNISADYNQQGKLLQAYINGNIVFPKGKPKRENSKNAEEDTGAAIYRIQRPRPEAYKGESSLGFLVLDRDANIETIEDQFVMGAGPSRADPINMGAMTVYTDIDPWRSIFDFDEANFIATYEGKCSKLAND